MLKQFFIFTLFLMAVFADPISGLAQQPDDGLQDETPLWDGPLTGEYKHWDEVLNKVNQTLNNLEIILFRQEVRLNIRH